MLALHYFGKKADDEHSFDFEIGNDLTNIDRVIEKFMEFSSANGISGKITNPICMAFDELLTNIISYAYVDGTRHEIGIKVSLIQDAVVIVITDDGLPFNPFTREDPVTDLSIEERGIGGLGIHLVKNVMDEAYYKRHVDRNVITIVKNIEQAK